MNIEFKNCITAFSPNAWMNDNLIQVWVNKVFGPFFLGRLLGWDSYECHMEESVKFSLHAKKIDSSIAPEGCTKYMEQSTESVTNKKIRQIACIGRN